MATTDDDVYAIRAIDRAIDVLQAFTYQEPALTLAEVAERTGLSKPTAFRVLSNLRRRGFIQQDTERGEYSLGFEMVTLAGVRKQQTKVWEAAVPYMRRVRDMTGETVLLCIRVDDERFVVDQVESAQPIRRVASVGERVPLYAGAGSRVLLAAMSDSEIEAYLQRTPLERLGPATIIDPAQLRAAIASVRAQGFAIGARERQFGGCGIAVGVRDYTGDTIAALQITVPTERWTDDARARALRVLVRTADELSTALGDRTVRPTDAEVDAMIAGLPSLSSQGPSTLFG